MGWGGHGKQIMQPTILIFEFEPISVTLEESINSHFAELSGHFCQKH